MSNKAYYNELDPKAAAWLRELIKGGHIAPGDVDERSIEDVRPADLCGYSQHHFFAGIGGWSYALRIAGWPDDKPVWTGSCPCQPFSAAGKGKGFADERHLWPAWFHLIRELRPDRIFGEQVANALGWLDLISADLEKESYAVGAAIVGAHSVGAPHIRQRLYWVADTQGCHGRLPIQLRRPQQNCVESVGRSETSELAIAESQQQHGRRDARAGRRQPTNDSELGHADDERSQRRSESRDGADERAVGSSSMVGLEHAESDGWGQRRSESGERSAFSGCWQSDWIACTDGKSRPVEPGTFPLAHGVPGRVGLLRGYGNAIVPQDAAEFIGAYLNAS